MKVRFVVIFAIILMIIGIIVTCCDLANTTPNSNEAAQTSQTEATTSKETEGTEPPETTETQTPETTVTPEA